MAKKNKELEILDVEEQARQALAGATPEVTHDHMTRLEEGFGLVGTLGHNAVLKPIEQGFRTYKHDKGRTITPWFLDTMYIGIKGVTTHLLHLSGDKDTYQSHFENPDYFATMPSRLRFAQALVDFTHAVTLEQIADLQLEGLLEAAEGIICYSPVDLKRWNNFVGSFELACDRKTLLNAGNKLAKTRREYSGAINSGFKEGHKFWEAASLPYDTKGIHSLF